MKGRNSGGWRCIPLIRRALGSIEEEEFGQFKGPRGALSFFVGLMYIRVRGCMYVRNLGGSGEEICI